MPVDKPVVAMVASLLIHVPPVIADDNVAIEPVQIVVAPVIEGIALTVIMLVVVQPAGVVYVIIEVPAVMPAIMPLPDPAVATPVVPLLQVPPGNVADRVVPMPAHIVMTPVSAPGAGLTDTVRVT